MSLGNKYVSLYCGGGGLDIGFTSAGFTCTAAFDNDARVVETHNLNLEGVAERVDLAKPSDRVLNALLAADMIVAGPPCQGFSTAGKNDPGDERNGHLHNVAELASLSRANVVVIENVRGLLAKRNVRHLEKCESMLKASGFRVARRLFDLSDFGIAQSRRRLIVVASRNVSEIRLDIARKAIKLSLRDVIGHLGLAESASCRPLSHRDKCVAARIGSGQRLTDVRFGCNAVHTWNIPEVFGATSASEQRVLRAVGRLRRRDRIRDVGDGDPVSPERVSRDVRFDAVGTLYALTRRGYIRRIEKQFDLAHTFNGKYKRLRWDEPAPTVDTRFLQPRSFLHPEADRGFSIREMALLQGFPETFTLPDPVALSSAIVGNAVPPTFAALLARQLRLQANAA